MVLGMGYLGVRVLLMADPIPLFRSSDTSWLDINQVIYGTRVAFIVPRLRLMMLRQLGTETIGGIPHAA